MTTEEKVRYSRQTAVEGFGIEGQGRLMSAGVAVVGCGALGSMVAMQLAGAGVGRLVISDYDTVDVSNLQRQLFYNTADCGRHKAQVLSERIASLNPGVVVECHEAFVDEVMAGKVFKGVDFVVDATDNPASKAMVERVCRELAIPCCIGGVSGFKGQVMTIMPGQTMMSDIIDEGDPGVLPCQVAGVLGATAAFCASLQASETIKHLARVGETLQGKMMTFDLRKNDFKVYSF